MPPLNITLVPAPYQVVVRIAGDADYSTRPLLADALQQAASHGTRQVVVDLAGAAFWDCSGLQVLTAFTADLGAVGRSCRIVGAPARTRRLITAAELDDRLHLDGPLPRRPTPAAARERVDPPPVEERPVVPARRSAGRHPVPGRVRRIPALAVRRRG